MNIIPLTKNFARLHEMEIDHILSQIKVPKAPSVMAEEKDGRKLIGKWDHSLVMLDGEKVVGVLLAYERRSERNEQYPNNTLYISEFAVAKEYQKKGHGRKLFDRFLKYNEDLKLLHLDGRLSLSLQTNSAEWNSHVVKLYESFGFKKRSFKRYDDRVDLVMGKDSKQL